MWTCKWEGQKVHELTMLILTSKGLQEVKVKVKTRWPEMVAGLRFDLYDVPKLEIR